VKRTPTKEPSSARRLRSDNWVLGAANILEHSHFDAYILSDYYIIFKSLQIKEHSQCSISLIIKPFMHIDLIELK